MFAVACVGGTAVDVDQNIGPSGTVQVSLKTSAASSGYQPQGRPRHVDGDEEFGFIAEPTYCRAIAIRKRSSASDVVVGVGSVLAQIDLHPVNLPLNLLVWAV